MGAATAAGAKVPNVRGFAVPWWRVVQVLAARLERAVTDKLAMLDGTTLHGGRIRVRQGLTGRAAHGVDTRAAIVALLLGTPSGLTEGQIRRAIGLSTGATSAALSSLTDECPALCETHAAHSARIYIDRDEWRRSGWHAGGVSDRRHEIRQDRAGFGVDWTGGYLPRAGIRRRNGRLEVAA